MLPRSSRGFLLLLVGLLLAALAPIHAASDSAGAVHGLFIGISRYRSMDRLAYCAEDAARMARLFQEADGPLRVESGRCVVLQDSQATLAGIRRELEGFRHRLRADDVFIFYFTGHGGGEDEPDAPPPDEADGHDETLSAWDSSGPHDEDLSDDQLAAILAAFPCRTKIVLIDACFSGGFVRDLADSSTMVLAACPEDVASNVAFAHRSSGAFTHAFMEGFRGEADRNRDGRVGTDELIGFLNQEVPLYCSECGRRNSPGARRCFYDREKLNPQNTRPSIGGSSGIVTWSRPSVTYAPTRCSAGSDHASCRSNPARCSCSVKGECGEPACVELGRRIPDGCRTAEERALCHEDAALCPCSEYGACGMSCCRSPSNVCEEAVDREACERNPEGCPCEHYGDCEMSSCSSGRANR